MNYYQDEFTAEYNRQRVIAEMRQIRLEEVAHGSQVYTPSRFERTMFNFANWLITTGKRLRKRYEMPTPDCSQTHSKSFAH